MKTVDDEIQSLSFKFIEKAKAEGKPFFLWLNPTRMHIVTHLSDKYENMRNSENGWTIHEAGMAQLKGSRVSGHLILSRMLSIEALTARTTSASIPTASSMQRMTSAAWIFRACPFSVG